MEDFVEALFILMLDHHHAQVGEADLTLVQAQALKLLRAAPLPASQLARALGISAPAITQLTDRLERKNLIERRTVSTDRRAVMVALTEKGGRLIDGFRSRRNDVFADTLTRLTEDDRVEVIGALSKVAAVLQGREQPFTGSRSPTSSRQAKQSRRTAIEAPEASKEIGEVSVSPPIKKRMRIEWD
jgi:DNA-binding MarR family transcriptional regulator